ncbi:MAG TPA: TAT-variant-translocated molybdopterin oxidoreductase [Puia sp.]|jgi:molybdopterin-containing oxidoreductase family iron-sulfur binding subunit|nr:TAT-variant-translocated molybdopterin oxidoreductase [Puia sp.]
MSDKKYWQSFGERNESEAFQKSSEEEFKESLPLEGLDGKGLFDAKHPRRDFLKYLGFSTAAATLAASCEMPVRHVVPYLNKPENMIPGVADYYATTYTLGGDVIPLVAKVRDGRPIKLEGNTLSSRTIGGTSARVQASVLDLYDMARLRYPVQIVSGKAQEVSTFEAFDKIAADALESAGGPIVLLTGTMTSPTTKQIVTDFLAKYPSSRHVQYDADSYSGVLLAAEASYGKRMIPSYRFDKAEVIVSLGADFLGTWLSPVEFARHYSKGRKIDESNPSMSKHYQFESLLSMTGGSADERYTHKPSQSGAVALALLAELGGSVTAPALPDNVKAGIKRAARDLQDNKGKGLVISGSNDVHVQTIVNAINEAIGASGSTVDWSSPLQTRQGIDGDMNSLIADLNDGKVGALLIYGVNPAYDYYDAEKFKNGLKKVKSSISFNDRLDETTELCKLVLPAPHFLESWGDTEAKPGFYSFLQPTIAPLFKTRPFEDSLLKWTGNNTTYEAYFKQYWVGKLGSIEAYEKALQDGVVEPATAAAAGGGAYSNAKVADAATAIAAIKAAGPLEIVFYQSIAMGVGAQANNPWLLELPDPVTRISWDNYAILSPKLAKDKFNIDVSDRRQADQYEVYMDKQIITLKLGGREPMNIPAIIIPGTHNEVLGIAVGFGRKSANPDDTVHNIGKAAAGVGFNAFPMRAFNGTTVDWYTAGADFDKTNETFKLAQMQTHGTYEGRVEVVKDITLDKFKQDPQYVVDQREEELKPFGGIEHFEEQGTLYDVYDKPGIHWGMSIDLNSCIGCAACVVACHAENNVSVVGKNEVLRFHDMHWIRIDRYYSMPPGSKFDNPEEVQVVFQPMLCQHCDNAPCENVCPVNATNHSSEGLNQMAYNRCIGTRYCENNCPYKVRRFNWADYNGSDSFPNNQDQKVVGVLDPAVFQMNDELTRMVLNPDVVTRGRGVMEKCSFCVQRLQDGKLKAKKENRTLEDMVDVQTACQQACPTEAIVFGNANDRTSRLSTTRKGNSKRLYHVIEELHTLPNISYLAKVRHSEAAFGAEGPEEETRIEKQS